MFEPCRGWNVNLLKWEGVGKWASPRTNYPTRGFRVLNRVLSCPIKEGDQLPRVYLHHGRPAEIHRDGGGRGLRLNEELSQPRRCEGMPEETAAEGGLRQWLPQGLR